MISDRLRQTLILMSLSLVLSVIGACAPQTGSAGGSDASSIELTGTEWRLTELAGMPAVPAAQERRPHIRFLAEDSRFEGFTGCNKLSGRYEHSESELRLDGPVAMTRMACLEQRLNEQETIFASVLNTMNRHRIVGTVLTVYGPEGQLAEFEAAPAVSDPAEEP